MEKWESYMLSSHSEIAAIRVEHLLVGTRVHAALEKILSSLCLNNKFRTNSCCFLEHFPSTISPPGLNWVKESAVFAQN